jgi:D-glycero-alpha-D-manno-heptose-7-phosphate kinase
VSDQGPIEVFAPARVDLSPGFTDVEPFCAELPGRVTNVALDLGVNVTLHDEAVAAPTSSFVDRLRTATARRLDLEPPGLRVATPSLPSGSGLGASGALSVALAYALSLRAGTSVEPADLVALACAAERDVGLTGGTQDQLASVYGGAGLVRRHGDLGHRVPIDARLDVLGERLVLVHGKGSRNSGSIIERVLHERPRAAVMRTIEAMNHTGEQLADSLRDADYGQVAGLMNESTTLLRGLDPDIVGDGVGEWLRGLGAQAAKPCGAGGPGAVWATLVDPAARRTFAARVTAAGWSVLPAAPSAVGAVRVGD